MYNTIKDIDILNKNIVIRLDYNVPIKDGKVTDDTRIKNSIPTLKYLIDNNCRIVILSHLGKIKTEEDKKDKSLIIVKNILENYINKKVNFVNNLENLKEEIDKYSLGDIVLVENTRFFDLDNKKESNCDELLSKTFASLGDIFVNDAFGTIHRKHASNYGISNYLPSFIGLLIEDELIHLDVLNNPDKKYIVIMGGSKISDKTKLINNIIDKVDYILIGGGMSFTFLKALGYNVGKSIVDDDNLEYCKDLLNKNKDKIILPIDFYCNKEFMDTKGVLVNADSIPYDLMGLDIGDKTIKLFESYLKDAKTILWNGPLGVYEFNNYQEGTKQILNIISNIDAYKVIGGGDIVSALNTLSTNIQVSHISTGGGATLSYLQGDELPGLINIKRDVHE